ncbi:unnamed protein product [Cuscuta campestris]|uniref:Uncharacterized protein n=1 Tax=Cuscuta campestris TaxID=132261 RepID=A0A484KZT0_9ASTE|nr:unnamed protein product [Cuscuta campestris]
MQGGEEEKKQVEPKHNDVVDPNLDPAMSSSPMSSPSSPNDFGAHTPQWSMMSSSPHHGMRSQLSFPGEHLDWNGSDTGYDPNRIPSSVFSSKPSMREDWSAASNESLFSVHMGNNGSFCRDERKSFSSSLPTLVEVSADREGKGEKISVGSARTQVEEEEEVVEEKEEEDEIVETLKSIPAKKPSEFDVERGNASPEVHTSPIVGAPQIERIQESARVSTGSTSSTKSFAFPVLVKDCSRREGPLKGDKGVKAESQPTLKPQSESESRMQQQPETGANPETSKEAPPEATQSGCFTCFSCWPRCC